MGRAMEEEDSKETEIEESSDFFDLDCEFDAPKFFDFTAQEELPWQAEEAQRWFMCAHPGYSPSPLIIKLKWRTTKVQNREASPCKSMDSKHSNSNASISSKRTTQGNESQHKSQLRPYIQQSSTLLKPTASHLAKVNHLGASSPTSNRRAHNPFSPLIRSTDATTTKRQKLENGSFKERAAQLRHQTSFAHKSPKKASSNTLGSTPSQPKVTVPKGPYLETSHRARRYMSVKGACQGDTKKSKQCTTKARPLSKKIFEGPFSVQQKKSTPCPLSPKSSNSGNSSEVVVRRFKSELANRKEFKLSGDKKYSHDPPTELFDKMSLKSDIQPTRKPKAISALC